eukprot:scaffold354602_cov38-Prasinocladus_malaysianus.AAC.1
MALAARYNAISNMGYCKHPGDIQAEGSVAFVAQKFCLKPEQPGVPHHKGDGCGDVDTFAWVEVPCEN